MRPIHRDARRFRPSSRQGCYRNRQRCVQTVNTRVLDQYAPRPKRTASVVGHSFIKDVRAYTDWSVRDDGFGPAIACNLLWQGSYNANKLRVQDHYKYIHFEWAYLFRSKEMDDIFVKVVKVKPQVLIINSASNDICEITKQGGGVPEAERLAYDMRNTARKLRDQVGIGHITFLTVIHRGKGFQGSQSNFERLMDAYNSKLIQVVGLH